MSCSGILSDSTSCTASGEWSVCSIPFFRALVGDFDTPPMWSDDRATEILKVAASQVAADLSGCSSVSVPSLNICTGDFSSNPYLYSSFFNLWQLKAACIVDQGLVRQKGLTEGIRAVCGPASLQVLTGSTSYNALFSNGPCAAYKQLREDLCFRNPIASASSCSQIVGTFVSEYLGDKCNGVCSYYR